MSDHLIPETPLANQTAGKAKPWAGRMLLMAGLVGTALGLIACSDSASTREEPNGSVLDQTIPASAVNAASELISQSMREAATQIRAQDIHQNIAELSSDAYGGRGPGTEFDIKTQQYLIEQMLRIGLQPGAADGGWLQKFDLIGLTTQQPDSWIISAGDESIAFENGSEFIIGAGVQAEQARVEDAELVFVGYGIQAPEYGWDDYKGLDVRGKILVVLNNDPHHDENLFAGETRLYYGRWAYKYEIAAQLGAAGVIIVHTDYSAGYPWQVVQTSWSGPQFELPNEGEPVVQLKAWMTHAASEKLLAAAGQNLQELTQRAQQRDFVPVALGLRSSLTIHVDKQIVESANVLGLLPGRQRADEAIIYTAHHDHLGTASAAVTDLGSHVVDGDEVSEGAEGSARGHAVNHKDGEESPAESVDVIYNGAMDNASGVASVLSIAKAFKALDTNQRAILFAFVGAEEQGLLGSLYYARHPTFAPGKIAANINMDGGQVAGRSKTISYIGYGRSTIDAVAEQVAQYQDRTVVGDQLPSAGYFYRSDHFSFARIGVPSLNFRGGSDLRQGGAERGAQASAAYVANHYHQPSDEITDAWRFDGLAEDAQFGFYAGVILSEQAQMPSWVAGDEFEAARKAALE